MYWPWYIFLEEMSVWILSLIFFSFVVCALQGDEDEGEGEGEGRGGDGRVIAKIPLQPNALE